MKAFLLAAGHGTRLQPLTDNLPKCLVPVRGTPMLQIWFDICRAAGIDEVLINIHAHAGQVREFVAKSCAGLRVTISEEPVLLGSAGTLRANREWVGRDEDFWVLYGDVLTSLDLRKMQACHTAHNALATMGVYEVENPRRCGIVTCNAVGKIVDFIEKPENPTSNLAFSGILLARSSVLDLIPADKPAPDIAFDLLPKLVGSMYAYVVDDFLIDIGTRETYERAQREWPGLQLPCSGAHAKPV